MFFSNLHDLCIKQDWTVQNASFADFKNYKRQELHLDECNLKLMRNQWRWFNAIFKFPCHRDFEL